MRRKALWAAVSSPKVTTIGRPHSSNMQGSLPHTHQSVERKDLQCRLTYKVTLVQIAQFTLALLFFLMAQKMESGTGNKLGECHSAEAISQLNIGTYSYLEHIQIHCLWESNHECSQLSGFIPKALPPKGSLWAMHNTLLWTPVWCPYEQQCINLWEKPHQPNRQLN